MLLHDLKASGLVLQGRDQDLDFVIFVLHHMNEHHQRIHPILGF
jgi:hypothetical protein